MADTPLIPNNVYIASQLHGDAQYGQNGDPNPSSLLPGQTVKRGAVGKSLVRGTEVKLPANNQTRDVGKSNIKPRLGMKDPNKATDKVPGKVSR